MACAIVESVMRCLNLDNGYIKTNVSCWTHYSRFGVISTKPWKCWKPFVKNGETDRYVVHMFHVLMVMLMADERRKSTRERKPPERLHNTVVQRHYAQITLLTYG